MHRAFCRVRVWAVMSVRKSRGQLSGGPMRYDPGDEMRAHW